MKNYAHQIGLVVIGLLVAISSSYLYAWTGPSQTAPAGNVDAPLNVGPLTQSKDGILGANGLGVFGPGYFSETGYSLPGNLLFGVNGRVGATEYCDENGDNCSPSVGGDDMAAYKSAHGLSMWPNKVVCQVDSTTSYVYQLGGIIEGYIVTYMSINQGGTSLPSSIWYYKSNGTTYMAPANTTCPSTLHLDGRLLEQ